MRSRSILLVVLVVTMAATTAAVAPVAGQSAAVDNATDAVDDAVGADSDDVTNEDEQLLYQFEGGGALRSVDYRDGSTWVTLAATDGSQRFAVSEGDLEGTGSFEYITVSVDAGSTRTVEIPVAKSAVVVTTTQDGYYYEGSSGPPVLTDRPTEELVQLAVVATGIGAVLSLGIAIGRLRRKHENTYTELFSDETKRIEQDAYEGWRDRIVNWFENRYESKISTVAGVVLLGYIGGVVTGVVPAPGDLWLSLSDGERLGVAVTTVATAGLFFPMYYLADRLYDPTRSFVADIDAADVYRAAGDDESGGLAIYSAPPERVNEMDVDGSLTRVPNPTEQGCYVVRGFDPEANTAAANPPTLSTDLECIAAADQIERNRERLESYGDIARHLMSSFPSFKKHAQFNNMAEMDSKYREATSIGDGDDGLVGIMEDALEDTEFEGIYGGSDDDPDDSDGAEEVTNDSDSDPATNGADK